MSGVREAIAAQEPWQRGRSHRCCEAVHHFRMNIRDLLLANLDEAFSRNGWHGTTLRGAIRGVKSGEVLWRPAAGRHNIWELVLHAAYWKYVANRRLSGARHHFPLPGSDWYASPPDADERGWREVVNLVDEQHAILRATVAALPASSLAGQKVARTIYGVSAHDVYHAGQISLIRRLQQS